MAAVAAALVGGVLAPAALAQTPPCTPTGAIPAALLTCRNWISFAPPRPFNPEIGSFPTEAQLRSALTQLAGEGWRGLVTYGMDGTLREVPRIAREVGFSKVIAGIYPVAGPAFAADRAATLEEVAFIDAIVVGNEGIDQGRYTIADLEREIPSLRSASGRPVTTSEPDGRYGDARLRAVGDWMFPNLHPWFANRRTPPSAAAYAEDRFKALEQLAPGQAVVIKESWWPTAGDDPAGNEANQADYFGRLARTPVRFVWGEAYDQYWKTGEPGGVGPHWGLHSDTGVAKGGVSALAATYTSAYPPDPERVGFAWYQDGSFTASGPSGVAVRVYATGAARNTYYRLVTGKAGQSDGPCRFDPQPVNPALRRSNNLGFIGFTSGVVTRPPGTWQVCFYEVEPGVPGGSATSAAILTIV